MLPTVSWESSALKLANGYCLTSYMDIIFSPDSLSDEQAKDLADWISIILGKEKVPVVKV